MFFSFCLLLKRAASLPLVYQFIQISKGKKKKRSTHRQLGLGLGLLQRFCHGNNAVWEPTAVCDIESDVYLFPVLWHYPVCFSLPFTTRVRIIVPVVRLAATEKHKHAAAELRASHTALHRDQGGKNAVFY